MQRLVSLCQKVTKQIDATHRDPRIGAADPQVFWRLLMREVAEVVWFLRYHLSGPFPARDSTKAYEQVLLDVPCRCLCARSAKWLRHICATRSTSLHAQWLSARREQTYLLFCKTRVIGILMRLLELFELNSVVCCKYAIRCAGRLCQRSICMQKVNDLLLGKGCKISQIST